MLRTLGMLRTLRVLRMLRMLRSSAAVSHLTPAPPCVTRSICIQASSHTPRSPLSCTTVTAMSSPSSTSPSSKLPSDIVLGFIGSGAMATALITGLINSNTLPSNKIITSDPDEQKLQHLQSTLHIQTTSNNADLVQRATILLLCVKPHIVHPVMTEIGAHIRADQLLISVAAGITLATLTSYLAPSPNTPPVARVGPNTPALIGQGATAITLTPAATAAHRATTRTIFQSVGLVLDATESQLDAVTGLSGSGPAFVFLFLEALSDGGVRAGLPRAMANQLAYQTVYGAAAMALDGLRKETTPGAFHVGQLKDQVASPGGTTIAGIHALERGGMRGAVMDAVYAAKQRAEEMGQLFAAKGGGGGGGSASKL